MNEAARVKSGTSEAPFLAASCWQIVPTIYFKCISTHPQTTQDQDPHHGHQAFPAAVPRLWNALPDHLKPPQTTAVFKKYLRLIFFKKPFANFPFTVYALYV
jgi:hypothetical protein